MRTRHIDEPSLFLSLSLLCSIFAVSFQQFNLKWYLDSLMTFVLATNGCAAADEITNASRFGHRVAETRFLPLPDARARRSLAAHVPTAILFRFAIIKLNYYCY